MNHTKTAIVTGGAKRVGKAISIFLAKCGYDVAIIYNSSETQAIEVKTEIELLGRETFLYKCDLNNSTDVNQIVSNVFKERKNIKLLINNASIFEKFNFAETNEDIFDRHLNINFKAPFFITQKYAEYCKNNAIQGHVINISDAYTVTNNPTYFIYLQTKKMLADFTKMAAKELEETMRVNAVSIGFLLPSEYWNEAQISARAKNLPIKRQAKMEEILQTIAFLDENQYITGENIFVDGGLSLG